VDTKAAMKERVDRGHRAKEETKVDHQSDEVYFGIYVHLKAIRIVLRGALRYSSTS
jgi:hypothetical protein